MATLFKKKYFLFWAKVDSQLQQLPYDRIVLNWQAWYNIPDRNIYMYINKNTYVKI